MGHSSLSLTDLYNTFIMGRFCRLRVAVHVAGTLSADQMHRLIAATLSVRNLADLWYHCGGDQFCSTGGLMIRAPSSSLSDTFDNCGLVFVDMHCVFRICNMCCQQHRMQTAGHR